MIAWLPKPIYYRWYIWVFTELCQKWITFRCIILWEVVQPELNLAQLSLNGNEAMCNEVRLKMVKTIVCGYLQLPLKLLQFFLDKDAVKFCTEHTSPDLMLSGHK